MAAVAGMPVAMVFAVFMLMLGPVMATFAGVGAGGDASVEPGFKDSAWFGRPAGRPAITALPSSVMRALFRRASRQQIVKYRNAGRDRPGGEIQVFRLTVVQMGLPSHRQRHSDRTAQIDPATCHLLNDK